MEKTFKIISANGLHARPAAELAREAGRWAASIKLRVLGRTVDVKSIMGLLSLAAGRGTEIQLIVEGNQEAEAFQALSKLITHDLAEIL